MQQNENQINETNDESERKELLAAPEAPHMESASEPHDYIAVTGSGLPNFIVRCPNCERLVGLNKIGDDVFTLERL